MATQGIHTSKSIAVLMTCHDRKESTVQCLTCLKEQQGVIREAISIYLVDDGCSDGTAEAVRNRFPDILIYKGGGDLYWAGGMRLAFAEAMKADPDFYLWLNDDTYLYRNALHRLMDAYHKIAETQGRKAVLIGPVCDPGTGQLSYGGYVRSDRWHPFHFKHVQVDGQARSCDTMNGNCVLIPREVASLVGNIDLAFSHNLADIDYGLRAGRAGCSLWSAQDYVGECLPNRSEHYCFGSAHMPLKKRLSLVAHPKGLPFKEWKEFSKRHGGIFWPFFCVMPYVRLFAGRLSRTFGHGP